MSPHEEEAAILAEQMDALRAELAARRAARLSDRVAVSAYVYVVVAFVVASAWIVCTTPSLGLLALLATAIVVQWVRERMRAIEDARDDDDDVATTTGVRVAVAGEHDGYDDEHDEHDEHEPLVKETAR